MNKVKKIVKNFTYQTIGQFSSRLITFLFFVYIARKLEPVKFGIFSFSMSIGYLVLAWMDFGLDVLSTKWIARGRQDYFGGILKVKCWTISSGVILMVAISLLYEQNIRQTMIVLAFGFAAISGMNTIFSYYRGIEKMIWESVYLFGQKLLLLMIGIVLIHYSATALSAAFAVFFSAIFFFILSNGILKKNCDFIFSHTDSGNLSLSEIFIEALPLAMVNFLWVIYYRVDTIMLGTMKGMASAGIYNSAYRIIEGLILVAAIVMIVQFPKLSRLGAYSDKELFFTHLFKVGFFLITASIGVSITFYFLSPMMFQLLFGSSYEKSIEVFRILLMAILAIYPGQLVTHALIAMDMQRIYMVIAMICAGTNILLNVLLIPVLDTIGAALATITTEFAMTILCVVVLYKKKKNDRLERPFRNGLSRLKTD